MKFSIGDKIVIKKTGEEGHLVGFVDQDMAEVNIAGTVFPIYLDEIDHPYLRWFTQQRKQQKKSSVPEQLPAEPPLPHKEKVASGVWLTFMPVFQTVDMEERVVQFRIYALNQTNYTVQLSYEVRKGEERIFSYEGILQPFSDIYLHYVDWDTMTAIPRFTWSLKEQINDKLAPVSGVVKIRSAKLFEHLSALQLNNQPTFRYLLTETFTKEKPKEQAPLLPADRVMPAFKGSIHGMTELPRYEVDLHIENLVDSVQGLSATDILDVQLTTLRKYLRIAVQNRQDRMVIIHGNGKGILRDEVKRVLKDTFEVDRFESGWQAGYGFGATIVFLNY
jgi:hypothetical protein